MTVLTRGVAQALVDEQGFDVVIPDIYTSIDDRAFFDNQLTSIVIPDSVTSIGNQAFYENQLTSVDIGVSVTSIGYQAFYSNDLTSVVIPDSVTSIDDGAFWHNKLTSVEIGNSVTNIGKKAFYKNKLTSVVIPDSVTDIGKKAFDKNPLLKSISISADPTFKLTSFPRGVEIIRRADPSVIDSDGDGFVDGITNYQVLTGAGGVDLINKKGKKYSDKSSRKWDAVKAITAFSDESSIGVLISGSGKKDNKFKMWSANLESGLVTSQTNWKNEPWMIKKGYEEIFDYDINDNGSIGY